VAPPSAKSLIDVLDTRIAYVEAGAGRPIVFLHGNPTSSYLWRNVIPHVQELGRCLAPDLVGMGDSGRPAGCAYRLADHQRYLDAFLEAVGASQAVVLVLHDWGSALGFDWARRHPHAVRGLAYMEAIVRPVSWDEWPEAGRRVFQGMRSEAGEELVLEKNVFVDRILPASVLRGLSEEELAEYRRPFPDADSRRPVLRWPRELPIEGEPADVVETVERYARWLERTEVPKLFVNAEPGSILVGLQREYARTWPNQTEVTVAGSHFVQEDSPDEIGRALADWIRSL
jgi:haloalkane dehalogenase